MKIKVPDLKKISKSEEPHKPGYGICTYTKEFYKQSILEQGSTPEDKELLKKLGIKKNEKILAIAGYYASWASFIKKLGAIVDYSDISPSMVRWAKDKYKKLFRKYITSNYELIPKREKEYDWTFTFEACGGKKGLCIAYLRSLLNNKGGILVLLIRKETPEKMGSKLKQYPLIVKTLAKIYGCKYSVQIKKIKGHVKGKESSILEHQISKLTTNDKARELAKEDLETLGSIQDKRKIKNLNSLKRLNKLTKIIDKRLIREVKIK
ncbi:MAG TPA: hypothetical protein VMC80_02215 [Patescibacteria group bacterium]|nr:hypothetical protein [Patescibacteria group bacterium]